MKPTFIFKLGKSQWNYKTDGFFSGFRMNFFFFPYEYLTLDITTIIIIETGLQLIMGVKIHIVILTTLRTVTGIISQIIAMQLMTGEIIKKTFQAELFLWKFKTLCKSSAAGQDDVLKDYPPRSYNRYDDRYYGREEQPYYNREPAYSTDTRYNSNYNSYRGNGKKLIFFWLLHHALLIHLMFVSLRTCATGYDNLNPTHYEAMRDRFQRGKCLKQIRTFKRF